MLYLGDEVGQFNDYGYAAEEGHGTDSRWVHRPHYPAAGLRTARGPGNPRRGGLCRAAPDGVCTVRSTPELAGTRLVGFATNNPGVLGYQRPGLGTLILALANFSDSPQEVAAVTLSGFAAGAVDVLTGAQMRLDAGLVLDAQQFVWLRVTPRP